MWLRFPKDEKQVFKKYLFYIGVWSMNNVVIVSGAQQSDSAIHIHVSILLQIQSGKGF